MELERFGFREFTLMDEERLDSTLSLDDHNREVLVLTNKRLIHLDGISKRRRALFTSITDITAVEMVADKLGNGPLIWAALAFIAATIIYLTIDQSVVRVTGALSVSLMGTYLIVDRLLLSSGSLMVIRARSSELRYELKTDQATSGVHAFINRLFAAKEKAHTESLHPSSRVPLDWP